MGTIRPSVLRSDVRSAPEAQISISPQTCNPPEERSSRSFRFSFCPDFFFRITSFGEDGRRLDSMEDEVDWISSHRPVTFVPNTLDFFRIAGIRMETGLVFVLRCSTDRYWDKDNYSRKRLPVLASRSRQSASRLISKMEENVLIFKTIFLEIFFLLSGPKDPLLH